MGKQERVSLVVGPLAPFAAGFESWLYARSYSPSAAADRMCQFRQLSRWLEQERLGVGELGDGQAGRFLVARAASWKTWVSPRGLLLPLAFLREVGGVPAPAPVCADGPLQRLLGEYQAYLLVERRLCEHTVFDEYGPVARMFLESVETAEGTWPGSIAQQRERAFGPPRGLPSMYVSRDRPRASAHRDAASWW